MSSQWEEKIWGSTRCTLDTDLYSRHELNVTAGGFCSFHYHDHRANRFRVVRGKLRVVWAYGWQVHYRDLTPDEVLDVPSLVPHQFQVLLGGEVVEEYFSDRGGPVETSDIVRLSSGGVLSKKDGEECREFMRTIGILLSDGTFWET